MDFVKLLLFLNLLDLVISIEAQAQDCRPIYVRWPRVRLHQDSTTGLFPPLSLADCQKACTEDRNPSRRDTKLQCSAFNHRPGLSSYAHECQTFSREHVQHTDGYMEADDRYTFYWKFCVDTQKTCTSEYAFTFLSDRYMQSSDVGRTKVTSTLEECLAECLRDSPDFLCRSVSFNRTDGGCHLSEHNQLSKPSSIRINNNPNYRIDYYENNCYNNSFKFTSLCEQNGIRIRVNSRIPYTGALYGLYDFFSCRIEPKEERQFEYLFPYPQIARNCSDSMRQTGKDIVLEVVLSTDGVEPLYFITADDLTYQARCPLPSLNGSTHVSPSLAANHYDLAGDDEKPGASINSILEALNSVASEQPSLRRFGAFDGTQYSSSTTTPKSSTFTKDVFTLPLYTKAPESHKVHINDSISDVRVTNNDANKQDAIFYNASHSVEVTDAQPTTSTINKVELKPTTIVVLQQGGNPLESSSPQILPNTGRTGMEAIFEDDSGERYPTTAFPETTSKSEQTNSTPFTEPTKTTTKRAADPTGWEGGRKQFTFSTHLAFPPDKIWMSTGGGSHDGFDRAKPSSSSSTSSTVTTSQSNSPAQSPSPPSSSSTSSSTTTTAAATTTAASTTTSSKATTVVNEAERRNGQIESLPPGMQQQANNRPPGISTGQREKIIFEIFHNGQPTEAVVVGSRITLAFTPYFAIPPAHMAISGCQVEPIGSLYEWEKEPLAIIKDGCQADHVGLVCPPLKTDYGMRVTVESFRYQTTTQVQYTCLIRICPFAPCPQVTCPNVEGCPGDDIVSRTFGLSRAKRGNSGENLLHSALLNLPESAAGGNHLQHNALQQQLFALGGDSIVRRKLIVVNSDDELRYYAKTGELPQIHPGN